MSNLIKAIMALYKATGGASLRALTTGGMWLSEAPKESSGVYIVITPVVAPVSYAMTTTSTKPYTEDCDIQFMVSTLTGTTAELVSAMDALKSLYDFCTLTISGNTLLVARRTNEVGPIRDPDTRGYNGYIDYVFMIGG